MTPRSTDEFMTAEEVAALFKVTRQHICALARKGKIPATHLGSVWRFERVAILAWARAQKGAANGGRAA